MHIPDGYLDPLTVAITYILMIICGIVIIKKGHKISEDEMTRITVLAAAIFVAQMLNWPIVGGTSLHFVGGTLASILYGVKAAFLIMFLVLFVQAIVFHDGGITTFGANVLNMSIIDVIMGYFVYRFFMDKTKLKNREFLGAFIGGWLGIVLAGLACGLEIGFSSQFIYGISVAVSVMVIWHAILGIIEGFITAFVVSYMRKMNVDVAQPTNVEVMAN
ncbi:MAG: energy-coupling factor ABC transporter permease [Candidatus Njordarchaeia archaeon]